MSDRSSGTGTDRAGGGRERVRWLDHSRNVDRIVWTLYGACALFFLADVLYLKHPHFGFESWFGFYALYGFVACVSLVLGAKQMRKAVMRRETYYEPAENGDDPGAAGSDAGAPASGGPRSDGGESGGRGAV